jgi:hypothetical protein
MGAKYLAGDAGSRANEGFIDFDTGVDRMSGNETACHRASPREVLACFEL